MKVTEILSEMRDRRDAYQRDYDSSQTGFGSSSREWDEGDKEPPNNFAIYINGKKWKVFPGNGYHADDHREQAQHRQLQAMCAKKTAATGKKWSVHVTGEAPTSESLAETTPGYERVAPDTKCSSCGTPYAKHFRFDAAGNIQSTTIRGLCGRPDNFKPVNETATAGATMSANIGTVDAPQLSPGKARGKKSYTGSPGTGSGTKAPPQPKVVQPKNSDGTAKNGLDMKGANLFGAPIKR